MAKKQRELNGALFKEENGKQDYAGKCTINDVEYYINGWRKTAASGVQWLSLSFKPVAAPAADRPRYVKAAGDKDDSPF